jgi:CTP synthase (UTP-ammonia lyase)
MERIAYALLIISAVFVFILPLLGANVSVFSIITQHGLSNTLPLLGVCLGVVSIVILFIKALKDRLSSAEEKHYDDTVEK